MDERIDILLIEDNPDDAGLTIRAFKKHFMTHRMLHFNNGEDALAYLFCEGQYQTRDSIAQPRIILLDLKMPKVDGSDVLKRIKGDLKTRNIPVVMLTTSNESTDIRQCYHLGANSYIVKPLEFEGLSQAIATIGHYWLLLNQY